MRIKREPALGWPEHSRAAARAGPDRYYHTHQLGQGYQRQRTTQALVLHTPSGLRSPGSTWHNATDRLQLVGDKLMQPPAIKHTLPTSLTCSPHSMLLPLIRSSYHLIPSSFPSLIPGSYNGPPLKLVIPNL
jgi:hypothetical protein